MSSSFTMRRRVAFSETDAAGIVHFSHFYRYMEDAEHAFFRSLGFSVVTKIGEDRYGWPRVHSECEHVSPLKFEDEFEVLLLVREMKSKAIIYDFFMTRIAPGPARRVAGGSITAVCVHKQPGGTMSAVAIPAPIAAKISPAGPDQYPADPPG